MRTVHPLVRRRRAQQALAVLGVFLGVLLLAFFRAQILSSSAYQLRAESNRLRPLPVPAPRGTIFDRNGMVIADNVPGYAVSILPGPTDTMATTLERMREYLPMSDARIEELMAQRDSRRPMEVESDADFEAVSALQARRPEFPNVWIEMRPKRRYVAGPATAHIMGQIGEINATELESEAFPDDRYQQGMIVGKAGVEVQYEGLLQGRPGLRYVEVDARSRVVGDFAGIPDRSAEPGRDITLNIDLELQQWIHSIFPDTLTGAVVALDPEDGGVLALYSAPTYDPNEFVGGIDQETFDAILESGALLNKPVQGRYAPASTFKLATAAIALDLGVVTADMKMEQPCTGSYRFGNRSFRCWKPEGHGDIDLTEAIQHSCDVYFYQMGLMVGLDQLLTRGTEVGFGERCGIDLPGEQRGQFPPDRDWWLDPFGYRAGEGEVLSLIIGQGPNNQTPLKMAQFYMAIARDGTAPAPQIIRDPAQVAPDGWSLDLSQEALEVLREGARRVTGPEGTAYLSSLEHWDLIGKSGSGENALNIAGLAEPDAWFAGMAGPRGQAPEIVVVVLVPYGGGGSSVAGPIVAKTADFFLRKKYGIPIDTIQTLGEHLTTSGWPEWANRSN